MNTYEVEVTYISCEQNKTIKNMLQYGIWGKAEAQRKERPSTATWNITGEGELTKELALKARIKFTKQFTADGHRVKSIKFRQVGALI